MFKEYNKNFEKTKNRKSINSECAIINHVKNGMNASKYPCKVLSGGDGVISIHVPEKKITISVKTEDIQQLISELLEG